MVQQKVGAVHIAGVDGGHDERRNPHAHYVVQHGLVACRLFRAFKTGGEREGVFEQINDARLRGGCSHGGLEAGCGTARESALHFAHTTADARCRLAEAFGHFVLRHEHAKVKGAGVEAARED